MEDVQAVLGGEVGVEVGEDGGGGEGEGHLFGLVGVGVG